MASRSVQPLMRGLSVWPTHVVTNTCVIINSLCLICTSTSPHQVCDNYITRMPKLIWEQVASPPLPRLTPRTTPNHSSEGSRTFGRKLIHYWLQWGTPHSPPNYPPLVDRSTNPTTCLIPGPIRPTMPCISDQPFCHSALDKQTDTQTSR